MNLLCYLFGHKPQNILVDYDVSVEECARCHSRNDYYYGGDQWTDDELYGKFYFIREWYYRWTAPIRHRLAFKCWNCEKRMGFFQKRHDKTFCSPHCAENWIPF